MRGNGSITVVAAALLCLLLAWPTPTACADDEPTARQVTVPDVRRRRLEDAMRVLEAAGLKVGTLYEFGLERVLDGWHVRGVVGTVLFQNPTPGSGWSVDKPVQLILVAKEDGRLPKVMPPTLAEQAARRAAAKKAAAKKAAAKKAAAKPAEATKGSAEPADGPIPPNRGGLDPIPAVPPPADEPAPDRPQPAPHDAPPTAEGSPDAPRKASKPDPDVVPEMTGLDLAEAEMLVRDAGMKLHVERVPGHPIGKVLEQVPLGGSKRPPGGMVKVVITAGGDFESRKPAPPAVYVDAIALPSLLDRTKLQAERIAAALGVEVVWKDAKSGLPGRVVDQKPAAGERCAKGGLLTLWIGPGGDADAPDDPPPPGPIGAKPTTDEAPGKRTPTKDAPAKGATTTPDAPKPPLAPGPLKGGVPQLVSPGPNTRIPPGAAVPVGFTWRGVTGANAYILEVEESGAEGRWLPLARKPARTTAVLMDVERLDPKGASKLRWRVTAVTAGRRGTPSAWVVLK